MNINFEIASERPPCPTAYGERTGASIPAAIHLKSILVPLDFSDLSLKSLRYAAAFAEQFGARLTLLHILTMPVCPSDFPYPGPLGQDHCASVERRLKEIREAHLPGDLAVDVLVRQGFIFDGILEVARELRPDLIILSTHGYTGLNHLVLGSAAENIVRRAPCPVMVVREMEQDFV